MVVGLTKFLLGRVGLCYAIPLKGTCPSRCTSVHRLSRLPWLVCCDDEFSASTCAVNSS
jgi:hypothetical protein